MYKAVRYNNPSYFSSSRVFAPANLFAVLLAFLLIGFYINEKDQVPRAGTTKQHKKLEIKKEPGVAYMQHGNVANAAPDKTLDFLTDIPALECCFKVISF